MIRSLFAESLLTQLESLYFLIGILLLATGIVLLLAALIPPHRTRLNYSFASFAIFLLVYALLFLSQIIPIPFLSLSFASTLKLLALLLNITLLAWFSLVVHFLENELLWVKVIWWGLVAFTAIVCGLIFLTEIVTGINATFQFNLTYLSIGLLLVAISYCVIAIVLIWQSNEKRVKWLRVPSLLIISAYITTLILPTFLINLLLLKIASLWIAYVILHQQIFVPIATLNQELAEKNENLQTTIADLEQEKGQVERLNKELRDSNRYKSQFLTMMSHELRTPLNAIVGYSELLTSPIYGAMNKQQIDRIERIHRNGKHLTYLIDTILDMDKLESKQLDIEFEPFNVNMMLDDLLGKIEPKIQEKSLAFIQDIEEDLPHLLGDKKRVQQILHNLLDNAIKFTPKGTVSLIAKTLSVSHGLSDDFDLPMAGWLTDGTWMLFQITDTGIGIAEEDLSNIFTNFVQLDGTTEREFGGIGLGLSITKELVEKHHGIIWVQSEIKVGTTFFVALPSSNY